MVVHKDFAEDERWVYDGFVAQIQPENAGNVAVQLHGWHCPIGLEQAIKPRKQASFGQQSSKQKTKKKIVVSERESKLEREEKNKGGGVAREWTSAQDIDGRNQSQKNRGTTTASGKVCLLRRFCLFTVS